MTERATTKHPMPEPVALLTERRKMAMAMCVIARLGHMRGGPFGASRTAYGVFYTLVEKVKKRGFKGRSKLVSAGRRGSGTPFVLDVWEAALSHLTDAEIDGLKTLLVSTGAGIDAT